MGGPKLLLPWGAGTILDAVLTAWKASRVHAVVVVVHPDDADVGEACRRHTVDLVIPEPPPEDMRASVLAGLQSLAATHRPTDEDCWLTAPADLPRLSTEVINLLVAAHSPRAGACRVPVFQGRRGHPALFPWRTAQSVGQLLPGEGLNRFLRSQPVVEVEAPRECLADDVDTWSDYERLRRGAENGQ
jgi:CTP:molybdopterin cytidylyltransferase MocA